jgi:hypothetical protein
MPVRNQSCPRSAAVAPRCFGAGRFGVLLATLAFCVVARAAEGPVRFAASPAALTLVPGGTAVVHVLVEIAPPYHIYAAEAQLNAKGFGPPMTEIAIKTNDVVAFAGAAKTSKPVKRYDPNFELDVLTLEGRAWIDVPIKAIATLRPGQHDAVLVVTYQACDDQTCLPPADVAIPFSLTLVSPRTAANPTSNPSSQ